MSKCRWCGKLTEDEWACECDNCWELRVRIEADLSFASRMLCVLLEERKEEDNA